MNHDQAEKVTAMIKCFLEDCPNIRISLNVTEEFWEINIFNEVNIFNADVDIECVDELTFD